MTVSIIIDGVEVLAEKGILDDGDVRIYPIVDECGYFIPVDEIDDEEV